MRKFRLSCLAVAGYLVSVPASAQSVELNVGHVLTTSSHYHAAAAKLAEVAAAKSNGQIKINIFPGAQLGGEVKQIQSVRTGTQDIVVTGEAPVENTVKDFTVFSFPYIFKSIDQANSVLQGPIGREMLDLLPRYNLVGLGFISALERNIFTNGKVVKSAADMKGLKIRVIQGPGYVKAYEALGAQPTPMAYTELYVALQNGAVDAAENSPDVFLQDRFIEVSKTYVLAKVMYMPGVIIMSKSKLDSLSPEHQKIMQEASAEAVVFANAHYKKDYEASLETMRKSKIEIIEPDLESFRATAPQTHVALLKEFPMAKPWLEKIQAATGK
ncbi:TRAP transporter substrate-binding protein [Bradyrhizobium sp. Arg237L]|uniref:TRAP transporter substrate-binding protein n=1 Tax=Bradyrhizobium sp. Arg237L TaxID=3003352 RepID=UPI00249EA1FA|nr:TRAP transporter substrate-binding protein [Bradyrhizobium sp. Arg237L]MDI4237100.1 TRAP transporter substrate-binding protein [Bradyrhizobium sp. Arg237L]